MTSAVPSFGAGANALKNSSTGKSQKLIAAVSMRPMSLHRWLSGRSLQARRAARCPQLSAETIREHTGLYSHCPWIKRLLDKAKADRATAQKRQRRQNPRKRQSAYRSIRSVFARLRCDFGTCSSKEAPASSVTVGHRTVNRRSCAEGLRSEGWRAQCRRSFPLPSRRCSIGKRGLGLSVGLCVGAVSQAIELQRGLSGLGLESKIAFKTMS